MLTRITENSSGQIKNEIMGIDKLVGLNFNPLHTPTHWKWQCSSMRYVTKGNVRTSQGNG